MEAQKTLSEGYREAGRLDLRGNTWMLVALNVVAFLATVGFAVLFFRLAVLLRGGAVADWNELTITGERLIWLFLEVLLLSAVAVIAHELLHALGFWAFTGERATFGFKGLYAYAGAPDWYLPRNQHIVTLLLPFVVISGVGILVMAVVPAALLTEVVLVLILNAAGAVGDLAALVWLLTKPRSAYVNDHGDSLIVFVGSDAT
ncbi:MAG: DUF3267 domain-containing protein [Anaerolineae bacterium]